MMSDVTVTLPADQLERLAASDLLKAVSQDERESLVRVALQQVLANTSMYNALRQAIEPSLAETVVRIGQTMKPEIDAAVRKAIQDFLNDLSRRMLR